MLIVEEERLIKSTRLSLCFTLQFDDKESHFCISRNGSTFYCANWISITLFNIWERVTRPNTLAVKFIKLHESLNILRVFTLHSEIRVFYILANFRSPQVKHSMNMNNQDGIPVVSWLRRQLKSKDLREWESFSRVSKLQGILAKCSISPRK